jgi:hypothetical protein
MDPKVWGPHFWFVLHIVSFNYPDNPNTPDKDNYKRFYESIGDILPCVNCRKHYKNHISKFPIAIHLDSRIDLIKWVIELHNIVNKALNKPIYTVDQILNLYSNLDPVTPFIKVNVNSINRKKIKKKYGKLLVFISIFTILMILLIYYHKKYYYYCM